MIAMKRVAFLYLAIACSIVLLSMQKNDPHSGLESLEGAWSTNYEGQDFVLLIQSGYCMFTQYNLNEKKFGFTSGGSYTASADKLKVETQFNSMDKTDVGKTHEYSYKSSGNELTTTADGFELTWKRVDNGDENIAGNWRITQRKQEDKMAAIPLRARRTLKLLTSSRFQWAAINIETGEFSGSGGGTYTFKDGVYTENIEFFSRDSSRVGISLKFNDTLENGRWIHTGKSSRGDSIYEVWEKMQP